MRASALNPKDVLTRKGKLRLLSGSRFPRLSGHDFAGEVVAVGGEVRDFQVGDRVHGTINAWQAGACADLAAVPASQCARFPAELSFTEAAALPLVSQTALQALRDEGRLGPGGRVLLHGASGGVGVHAIQIARALGARVTTTSSARNLDLCRGLGAHEALDYATDDPLTRGPYEVILDIFGNRRFSWARPALVDGGAYVSTVPSARILAERTLTLLARRRARLVVIDSRTADLTFLGHLVQTGRLRAVVDRTLPLASVAHRYLESKRARGKVVLDHG